MDGMSNSGMSGAGLSGIGSAAGGVSMGGGSEIVYQGGPQGGANHIMQSGQTWTEKTIENCSSKCSYNNTKSTISKCIIRGYLTLSPCRSSLILTMARTSHINQICRGLINTPNNSRISINPMRVWLICSSSFSIWTTNNNELLYHLLVSYH